MKKVFQISTIYFQESPEFWENNAIIKRTPVEDGIIKIFEGRKKKGGTMFPKK